MPAPALVGRLTNKNEAQLSSENKNSYFEVCIVFNIMLKTNLLEALKHRVDKNEVPY